MWKISDVRCRRASLAFASLMPSTGSWQPRARNGSRTHWDHISNPPSGLPRAKLASTRPQRQMVRAAASKSARRPGLEVFGPGVETNFDKSPRQVFGYPEPVAGHEEECR